MSAQGAPLVDAPAVHDQGGNVQPGYYWRWKQGAEGLISQAVTAEIPTWYVQLEARWRLIDECSS
jgi:hypothetical protein